MVTSRGLPKAKALAQVAKQYPELDILSIEACLTFLDTTAEVHQAFAIRI